MNNPEPPPLGMIDAALGLLRAFANPQELEQMLTLIRERQDRVPNSRPRLTPGSNIETKTQSPSSGLPAPSPSSQSTAEPKKPSQSQKRDANE
jgi:hypothetical protein